MKVCPRCSEVFQDHVDHCPSDGDLLVGASDPLIGRTIGGRYRLISRLGVGGMSSVYLARHVLIDRLVAVKSLRRDLAQDPLQRDRFIREARAVNRINHDNIVEITDFGETEDGLVYLVMEYVPGEPLFRAMSRGPFTSLRALHMAEQIGAALGRAHQMGVVHRDLKPENLLLVPRKGRPDFIKILDFGIAKILDAPSLTGSQQIFGTPGYIAPEYIQSTNIDGRADLYSLGVILYELVTGALPFDYEYPGDLLVKHVTEPPIPPRVRRPEVEPAVEALILQCLEKDPDKRFRDAYHFLEALRSTRERIGGDESWSGMSGDDFTDHEAPVPTPAMRRSNQEELLRRTIRDEAPPEPEMPHELDDLRQTQRDAEASQQAVPKAASSALRIPPPPRAERAGDDPVSGRRAGVHAAEAELPVDGMVGTKRWRRRFDAIRTALDDIRMLEAPPTYVEQRMAFCENRLEELEQAVEGAQRHQQEMEGVDRQGREHRVTLGRETDEAAEKLSCARRQLAELQQRRHDLELSREEHLRALSEEGQEPAKVTDPLLWEVAAVSEEIRACMEQQARFEARLEELHRELEQHGATVESRLADLSRACQDDVARLDSLAGSLRAPLESVERYIRSWWDEHQPVPESFARGR